MQKKKKKRELHLQFDMSHSLSDGHQPFRATTKKINWQVIERIKYLELSEPCKFVFFVDTIQLNNIQDNDDHPKRFVW